MQPYNYTIQAQDPFASYYKGYELGQAEKMQREEMAMRQQAMQQKMAQDQAAAQRAQLQAMATQELTAKIRAGTALPADIQSFALIAPKDQSEAALKVWEGMGKEQQQNTLGFTSQVLSAFGSKKPEIGIQLLNDRATAERNSGREDQAKAYETWAKIAETDPTMAQVMIAPLVGQLPGGDKVIEAWTKAQGESRARELQPLEVAALKRKDVPSSIQEAIDYGNLTPEQQKTMQALQVLKKPPAAVTNVNVTNLEKSASAEFGKIIPDLYDQAQSAASQLQDIPRYRTALDKAITGPFAEQRLQAARIAELMGFNKGDKGIAATREVIQGLSEMALKSRSMLTGQGQITEGEQKLLIKARSGDIEFNKDELNTIFKVAERASKAQYAKSKNLLSSAATKSETAQMFLQNIPGIEQTETPSASLAIVAPNGKTYTFPNQKAADDFKRAAGIK